MHFHYDMSYMATSLLKDPCPGGHENYNFGWPFLGHYYYALSLSESCPKVEKKIFKQNNALSLFVFYGHAPAQESLPQGQSVDSSLVIITIHLVCLNHAPRVEKKIFKE